MTPNSSPKADLKVLELLPEIGLIKNAILRRHVIDIWQELWHQSSYERLEDLPVNGTRIPYSHIRHNQAVLRACVSFSEIFRAVHGNVMNLDHLLAGAALMDVSKLVESERTDSGVRKTELGNLLPHGLSAAHLALARGIPIEIVHIIMCHSPNSGTAPRTAEAHLLHWLDQADLIGCGFDVWQRKVNHTTGGNSPTPRISFPSM